MKSIMKMNWEKYININFIKSEVFASIMVRVYILCISKCGINLECNIAVVEWTKTKHVCLFLWRKSSAVCTSKNTWNTDQIFWMYLKTDILCDRINSTWVIFTFYINIFNTFLPVLLLFFQFYWDIIDIQQLKFHTFKMYSIMIWLFTLWSD